MRRAVDVIITTRNEEKDLPRLLRSLLLDGASAEQIIVVDGNSSDRTGEIARALGARVIDCAPDIGTQRNCGAAQSSAQALLFLDADMEIEPGLFGELSTLVGAGAQCVVIPEKSIARTFLARGRAFERSLWLGGDLSIEAARLFSSQLFEKLGGYETNMFGGEDWLLARRAYDLCSVVRSEKQIFHHEEDLTLKSTFRKYFTYGQGFYKLFRKDRELFSEHVNPVRRSVREGISTIIRHPSLAFAALMFRAAAYPGGLCGFLSAAVADLSSWRRKIGGKVAQ